MADNELFKVSDERDVLKVDNQNLRNETTRLAYENL
jgi:hypothetical protein